MNCKVCNTRISAGDRSCPNCGTEAPAEAAFQRTTTPGPLPSSDLSTAIDPDDEVELELNEVSGEQRAATPSKPSRSKSGPKGADPRKSPSASDSQTQPFAPDASGLRSLLAEHPEMLERGLGVFRNNDGVAVGANYSSGVGSIDLLGSASNGDLVVVMISEKDQGEELVGEVLQRLGWVRKHVGEGKRKVRGIVLCQDPPESLSYAAAAVADTVAFKTYRVALAFEDIEV